MNIQAYTKFARMSPKKVREVAREIQGMNAAEALDLLRFIPRKSARLLRETLSRRFPTPRITTTWWPTADGGKAPSSRKGPFSRLPAGCPRLRPPHPQTDEPHSNRPHDDE